MPLHFNKSKFVMKKEVTNTKAILYEQKLEVRTKGKDKFSMKTKADDDNY